MEREYQFRGGSIFNYQTRLWVTSDQGTGWLRVLMTPSPNSSKPLNQAREGGGGSSLMS